MADEPLPKPQGVSTCLNITIESYLKKKDGVIASIICANAYKME